MARLRALSLALALASGPSAIAAPGGAAAALDALGAADRARATLAREQAEWAIERDRQEALVQALAAEARRLEARADALRTRAAALTSDPAADDLTARLTARRAEADRLAAEIHAGLAPLAPRWSPPEVAPGLDGALGLLRAAEQAAQAVDLAVQTGQLDGRTVAVDTVRVGLGSMWWQALDRSAAGVVAFEGGQRVLRPLDDAGRQAVAEAMAIAGGQRAPRLLDLPLPAPEPAP